MFCKVSQTHSRSSSPEAAELWLLPQAIPEKYNIRCMIPLTESLSQTNSSSYIEGPKKSVCFFVPKCTHTTSALNPSISLYILTLQPRISHVSSAPASLPHLESVGVLWYLAGDLLQPDAKRAPPGLHLQVDPARTASMGSNALGRLLRIEGCWFPW